MATAASSKRRYRMVARAETAAATKGRILATAWRHFSERPYDEVRVADVAADAGVSVPTVHAHMGSKEELFVASWVWRMTPEGARRDSARVGDVRGAIRVLYDSYEADGDAVLLMLVHEHRIPAVHAMADRGRAWHRDWVARTFAPLLEGLTGARRERRLAALIVATDLLVWKLLRREMDLGRRAAETIVIEMITAPKGSS